MRYCLSAGSIDQDDLDYVVFYDKPLRKFDRLLETYLAFAPAGLGSFMKALPQWLRHKLHVPKTIAANLTGDYELLFTEHHEAHAASAFYPSPFQEAAIISADGVGEWATCSWALGRDNHIEARQEIHFPHSLGLLYSAFTYFTGFKVNSGEYKLMGLAPYGEPRYAKTIRDHLIELREDGSFRLNMRYFNYCQGLTMTNSRFADLFGGPPRAAEAPLTQREMDLAASVQKVTEEAVLNLAAQVHRESGMRNLCLAGGVALNCVANGRLLREGPFDNIFIQPAAGDAGGALGAAFHIWHQYLDKPRVVSSPTDDSQQGSLLGPAFDDEEIAAFLAEKGAAAHLLNEEDLLQEAVSALDRGLVVGWFQGRMEFGPRALGNRSILADPRNRDMQRQLNLKIKFRESFRPFAPMVLEEHCSEYFELETPSPYMLLVADVCQALRRQPESTKPGLAKLAVPHSTIPAVTHVDYSARVQTVDAVRNPLLHRLLQRWQAQTGCAVLVNTSFNVRGEPIVCRPQEAWCCFMATQMDVLILGRHLLVKSDQAPWPEAEAYLRSFEPD